MFDASHFSPNGNIEVKITGHDNLGRYYEGIGTAPNKTLGRCFRQDPLEGTNGAAVAYSYLQSMNYEALLFESGWDSHHIGARIRESVLFVESHRGDDFHETCDVSPLAYASISAGNEVGYEQKRTLHNGSGLPPYNSTGLPPINFLDLEFCNSGDTGEFDVGLAPYTNIYVPPATENQAVWSYTVYINSYNDDDHAAVIYSYLSQGLTVNIAKAFFLTDAQELGIICWDEDPGISETESRPLTSAGDIAIFGDPLTRVKNVYTGSQGIETGWFRPL